MTPRVRALLVLASLAVLAGCHTFQPVTYEALAPGQDVRARVTGVWADSLDAFLLRDARTFEGQVVENRPGSVLLEVPVHSEYTGMALRSIRQRVELPPEAFVDLELKRMDRGRTLGAVAAGAVVVAAVAIAQLTGDSGGAPSPGEPGPVDSWIPAYLLRLAVP